MFEYTDQILAHHTMFLLVELVSHSFTICGDKMSRYFITTEIKIFFLLLLLPFSILCSYWPKAVFFIPLLSVTNYQFLSAILLPSLFQLLVFLKTWYFWSSILFLQSHSSSCVLVFYSVHSWSCNFTSLTYFRTMSSIQLRHHTRKMPLIRERI